MDRVSLCTYIKIIYKCNSILTYTKFIHVIHDCYTVLVLFLISKEIEKFQVQGVPFPIPMYKVTIQETITKILTTPPYVCLYPS